MQRGFARCHIAVHLESLSYFSQKRIAFRVTPESTFALKNEMTINRTMGEHFPELAAVITCLLVLAVKNITDPVTLFFSALPLQITPVGCMEIIFYAILSAGTAWFLKTFLDHHKERITTFFKSKNKTE